MVDVEKLIENVHNNPILYDVTHAEYKNIRKKDKIWENIGVELKESGENIKKRWKNLRDTYGRYIRATKGRTGQAANSKKWVWAEHMTAFRPYLAFAPTSSNISDIECVESNETIIGTPELDNFSVDCAPVKVNRTQSAKNHPSTQQSSVGELIEYFEKKKKVEQDSIDCLFMAHAKTVKSFSKRRQLLTKQKISEIIMEQEMLEHDEAISSSTPIFRNLETDAEYVLSDDNSTYSKSTVDLTSPSAIAPYINSSQCSFNERDLPCSTPNSMDGSISSFFCTNDPLE
ncbi:PREDICTED: uncharacterized protein LOC108371412 [Rhagoletis zephyria]|uniref:uncharacterized protein LOC108371412 n=1 Tax=Rhagoletis zephyria TaxID=28612 RepID=UPI000811359F|nr:PREDICTED: uncharacterized protein LOC108371412 [Rhagoletis zephyria]